MKNLRAILAVVALLGSCLAFSQSINSFQGAVINGVTVTQSGNQLTLDLNAAPTMTYLGNSYNIVRVWGVYLLDYNPATFDATGVADGLWNFEHVSGTSGIYAGWEVQNNANGLSAGNSKTFNFTSVTGTPDTWGIDVVLDHELIGINGPTGGVTGRFRPEAVPEPASLIVLGGAVAAAFARRRKQA